MPIFKEIQKTLRRVQRNEQKKIKGVKAYFKLEQYLATPCPILSEKYDVPLAKCTSIIITPKENLPLTLPFNVFDVCPIRNFRIFYRMKTLMRREYYEILLRLR